MSRPDPLTETGAATIRLAFARYRRVFRRVTRRARRRFERREWHLGQHDARERLGVYRRVVQVVVRDLGRQLGERVRDTKTWREIKSFYEDDIAVLADVEIAETFFNSITRNIFTTVGVDPSIEFVDFDFTHARPPADTRIHRTYPRRSSTAELVRDVLAEPRFEAPFRDVDADAAKAAERIEADWEASGGGAIEAIELIDSVFYRGRSAYLVGRICGEGRKSPLVIALLHGQRGIEVDAVLSTESEVSIVFSYTRSYFHVEVLRPSEVVRFLHTLIPRKPIAELFMSLGYNKHGKTEMYRSLLAGLARTKELFDHAPGQRGMVMIVFGTPNGDYVFKVIRDEFAHPKTTTSEDVKRRYQLVFQHDRAGRLVEAQEFEHLTFRRDRFQPELFEELASGASKSVTVESDEIAIHHLYIERRVRPLDLYLREEDDEYAFRAVVDYGQAIRDLAATNIFPGDLLLKNFGVTRHGRVIFYDYDELCLVTDCNFRDLPTARGGDEEMSAEPWFYVGEHDVFPEEFANFLGLPKDQRVVFCETHGELLTADFWRDLRTRHEQNELIDVFPYPQAKRLAVED